VQVTHTEMFTRISVNKIMTLKEAKKETKKVKTEIQEKPQEPLNLAVRLDSSMKVLEDLYVLIRRNPGNRPLNLTIISKLHNVIIESAIHVSNNMAEALEGNAFVDVIQNESQSGNEL